MTGIPHESSDRGDTPPDSTANAEGNTEPASGGPPRKGKSLLTHGTKETKGKPSARTTGESSTSPPSSPSSPPPASEGKNLLRKEEAPAKLDPSSPSRAPASSDTPTISKPKGQSLSHANGEPENTEETSEPGGLKQPASAPKLGGGDPAKLRKRSVSSKNREPIPRRAPSGRPEEKDAEGEVDARDVSSSRKQARDERTSVKEPPPSDEEAVAPIEPRRGVDISNDSREVSASPALTDTLRRIHEREKETGASPVPGPEATKSSSTLPETMARLNRENRFRERVNRALGKDGGGEGGPKNSSSSEPSDERTYVVDDPSPGPGQAVFHFVFLFGRFANGVQLAQPVGLTLACLVVGALGMILPFLPWLVPDVASPTPIVDGGFLTRVFASGTAGGLAAYVAMSLLFNLAVRARFGRVGLLFGLRVVTGALFPLAVVQVACLATGLSPGAEAFWRGAPPEAVRGIQTYVFPLLWTWGGLRLAQAVARMDRMPLAPAAALFTIVPLLFFAATLPSHPAWRAWRLAPLAEEVADVEARMGDPDSRTLQDLASLENRLPFRAVRLRRRVYEAKIEALARMDRPRRARAACRQLEFSSPPKSPQWFLARGVNVHLLDKRPDVAKNLLLQAVEQNPELAAARKWTARALRSENPEAALPHARKAFELSDTVRMFTLYLDVLELLDRPGEIWDAMLATERPPETWPDDTLRLGAATAERLGNLKRAERLRELLAEHDAPAP